MNFTSRMAALLGELRRERNGAVADAMRVYGKPIGLNYGVSLSTVRQIARAEAPDHDFALYLYLQDVRELRLVALHIAVPDRVAEHDFDTWASGIINSEIAEEAAFALLNWIEPLAPLFDRWIHSDKPLLQYAALLAASRSQFPSPALIEPALEVVRRNATAEATAEVAAEATAEAAAAAESSRSTTYAARLIAQGAVALLTAIGSQNEENRQTVLRVVGSPNALPAEDFVHEELVWRLNKE